MDDERPDDRNLRSGKSRPVLSGYVVTVRLV